MKRVEVTYVKPKLVAKGRSAQCFEDMHEAEFHDEAVGGYMAMVRMVGIAAFICAFVGATHLAYSYAISNPMEVVD